MSRFRRGAEEAATSGGGEFAELARMPDSERERLCRGLLDEFGATNIRAIKRGTDLVHSCVLPFGMHAHGDRNPSARLNWKKLTYHCDVCGGGGLLWFIATCRGESSADAIEWLQSETGMGGVQDLSALLEFLDAVFDPDRSERAPIPRMDSRVLDDWRFIHPYLTEIRGIPEDNVVALDVGYGTFDIKVDEDKDTGKGIWVNDSERIVIPHIWKGELVGWQTRRLLKDGTSKYLSSPDFPKDQTIYNFDPSREVAVVVESPMSVIAKHHVVPNMEATFGANVTDEQVRLLAEHRHVILWMDNDHAGWQATHKVAERLGAYGRVSVVECDLAADAADLDDETVVALVDGAVPYAIWRPPHELYDLDEHRRELAVTGR